MLTAFIVVVWLGEVERQVRAGAYLVKLETRIGARYDEPPLRWESELRRIRPAGRRILSVYRSVVAILLTMALGGSIIAVVGLHSHGTAVQVALALADAVILMAVVRHYGAAESRMRAQIAGREEVPGGRLRRSTRSTNAPPRGPLDQRREPE